MIVDAVQDLYPLPELTGHGVPVVAVTDEKHAAAAVAVGAAAVVLSHDPLEIVVQAATVASCRYVMLPRAAADELVTQQEPEPEGPSDLLKPENQAILQQVAHEVPVEAVAERMSMSPRTVSRRLVEIIRVLGVRHRTAAVVKAVRLRLIDPPDR